MKRIVDCLTALAGQQGGAPGVLLLVNNATDGTMGAMAEVVSALACPVLAMQFAEPDWLAGNLHHLRHGMDAVFGRAEIDPLEATQIPPALHQADAEECAYATLLDRIACLIDPASSGRVGRRSIRLCRPGG